MYLHTATNTPPAESSSNVGLHTTTYRLYREVCVSVPSIGVMKYVSVNAADHSCSSHRPGRGTTGAVAVHPRRVLHVAHNPARETRQYVSAQVRIRGAEKKKERLLATNFNRQAD